MTAVGKHLRAIVAAGAIGLGLAGSCTSFAAAALSPVAEYESAKFRVSGGQDSYLSKTGNDPRFTSNGALLIMYGTDPAPQAATITADTPAYADKIIVSVRGEACSDPVRTTFGRWPHLVVSVDGVGVISTFATSHRWQKTSTNIDLPAGRHTFTITFDNDLFKGGICDRVLRIDHIALFDLRGARDRPLASARAFSDTSTWNLPASQKGTIVSNPFPASDFHDTESQMAISNSTQWGTPFCRARPGDPAYVWTDVNSWIDDPDVTHYHGEPIPLPASCHQATGSDGHLAIITADGRYSYEFWRADVASKTAQGISRFDLSSAGTGWPSTSSTSARASGAPLYDTDVRLDDDFQHAEGCTIPHASPDYVPPATQSDGDGGEIKYGMLFVLRPDFPVSGSPTVQAFERELQTYGCYVDDQGSSFGIDAEPGTDLPPTLPITSADLMYVRP